MKNIKFLILILILGFFSCNEIKHISNIKNSSEKNIKNNLITNYSITPSLNSSINYNNEVINLPQSLYVVTSNNIFIFDKNGKISNIILLENDFNFNSNLSNNRVLFIKSTENQQILRIININDNIKKDFILPIKSFSFLGTSYNNDKIFFIRDNNYFFINENNEEIKLTKISYNDLKNESVYKIEGSSLFYTSKNNIVLFEKDNSNELKDNFVLKLISEKDNPEISLDGKYIAYQNFKEGLIIRDLEKKIDKQIYNLSISTKKNWINHNLIYLKDVGFNNDLYKYNIEKTQDELIEKNVSDFNVDYLNNFFYYNNSIYDFNLIDKITLKESLGFSKKNLGRPYFQKFNDFIIYEKLSEKSKFNSNEYKKNTAETFYINNPYEYYIYDVFLYDKNKNNSILLLKDTTNEFNFKFSTSGEFIIYSNYSSREFISNILNNKISIFIYDIINNNKFSINFNEKSEYSSYIYSINWIKE
ncbi:MAG: hypothetical protein U0457_00535 [Candidatus Sericytochromatia bacterium]